MNPGSVISCLKVLLANGIPESVGATRAFAQKALRERSGHSKIAYFDIGVGIYQNIRWLQVSMHYVRWMDELDGLENVVEYDFDCGLGYFVPQSATSDDR